MGTIKQAELRKLVATVRTELREAVHALDRLDVGAVYEHLENAQHGAFDAKAYVGAALDPVPDLNTSEPNAIHGERGEAVPFDPTP